MSYLCDFSYCLWGSQDKNSGLDKSLQWLLSQLPIFSFVKYVEINWNDCDSSNSSNNPSNSRTKVTFSSLVNPLPPLLPSHKLEWQHREEHLRFCCCSSLYNSPFLLQSEQAYGIYNLVLLAWETFQQTTLFHPGWH